MASKWTSNIPLAANIISRVPLLVIPAAVISLASSVQHPINPCKMASFPFVENVDDTLIPQDCIQALQAGIDSFPEEKRAAMQMMFSPF
ncbi:expressed unknown protein [Seminavis robusta]|uniref:Uncharacterized protein n=1 Tax=Seminavis robusta TaxID=568900 RepID=A0A9N8EV48_9STRA|nr:expressed unknown protein [Seminavis robusta]|eukprot:Sro1769_g296480.1 n/a (89) ;mRNA; f:13400-13666